MTAGTSFRYETRLDILHGPLEVIDEKALRISASSPGITRPYAE
jgi:hypothetical protein